MLDTVRRHIFLVDGLGAAVSTISPLLVLPRLEPWLGLSLPITWVLAVPAAVLALWSLTAWMRRAPTHPWLLLVMLGNLGFCGFLPWWLWQHAERVTTLGWVWCAVEVGVIASLVALEAWIWRGDAGRPAV